MVGERPYLATGCASTPGAPRGRRSMRARWSVALIREWLFGENCAQAVDCRTPVFVWSPVRPLGGKPTEPPRLRGRSSTRTRGSLPSWRRAWPSGPNARSDIRQQRVGPEAAPPAVACPPPHLVGGADARVGIRRRTSAKAHVDICGCPPGPHGHDPLADICKTPRGHPQNATRPPRTRPPRGHQQNATRTSADVRVDPASHRGMCARSRPPRARSPPLGRVGVPYGAGTRAARPARTRAPSARAALRTSIGMSLQYFLKVSGVRMSGPPIHRR